MIRAVLFDLDGTLLDTLEDLRDSMNAVLAARGDPPHDLKAYGRFIGEGMEMLVRRALPAGDADDATIETCVAQMEEQYARRWDKKSRPYPGVPELLDALVQRRRQLAVLSNKPHDFTRRLVERLLQRWPFDPVLGSRPGVPKKPDPTVAHVIAKQHGIPPEQWLYLGDTATDMKTARAVGMVAVGVLWGFRGAEELRAGGAEHLIEHPADLLPLL